MPHIMARHMRRKRTPLRLNSHMVNYIYHVHVHPYFNYRTHPYLIFAQNAETQPFRVRAEESQIASLQKLSTRGIIDGGVHSSTNP
jgi:hypothetical protein